MYQIIYEPKYHSEEIYLAELPRFERVALLSDSGSVKVVVTIAAAAVAAVKDLSERPVPLWRTKLNWCLKT